MDGDGDMDLLWGDIDNGIGYFENTAGRCKDPEFDDRARMLYGNNKGNNPKFPSSNWDIGIGGDGEAMVQPQQTITVADVDKDGRVELFSGRRGENGRTYGLFQAGYAFDVEPVGSADKEVCYKKEEGLPNDEEQSFQFRIFQPSADYEPRFKVYFSDPNYIYFDENNGIEKLSEKQGRDLQREYKFKYKLRSGISSPKDVKIAVDVEWVKSADHDQVVLFAERLRQLFVVRAKDCSAASEKNDGRIAGTVYEDITYPGGLGRPLSKANAQGIGNAVVELYRKQADDYIFLKNTRTNPSGEYAFDKLSKGEYGVRVVSSLLVSQNIGTSSPTGLIQTFRVDYQGSSPVHVDDEVGGSKPMQRDAGAMASAGGSINVLLASGETAIQSLSRVNILKPQSQEKNDHKENVDFGFSPYVVVNSDMSAKLPGSLPWVLRLARLDKNPERTKIVSFRLPDGKRTGQPGDPSYKDGVFTLRMQQAASDNNRDYSRVAPNTVLDATTQPGAALDPVYGRHTLKIVIDAEKAPSKNIFELSRGDVLKGFMLGNTQAVAVLIDGANGQGSGNRVESNFFGFRMDSKSNTYPMTVRRGVQILSKKNGQGTTGGNNVIGSASYKKPEFEKANFFANNEYYAVEINPADDSGNPQGNTVGSNIMGAFPIGGDHAYDSLQDVRPRFAENGTQTKPEGAPAAVRVDGYNNSIVNNYIFNTVGNGIEVAKTHSGVAGGYITGNIIKGNTVSGIYFTDDVSEWVVGGWHPYEANVVSDNIQSGIWLGDDGKKTAGKFVDGITIARNRIFGNGQYSENKNTRKMGIDLRGDRKIEGADEGDSDSGDNDLMNSAEVTKAEKSARSIKYSFDYNGAKGKYLVQLYVNHLPADEASLKEAEPGQGKHFVGLDTFDIVTAGKNSFEDLVVSQVTDEFASLIGSREHSYFDPQNPEQKAYLIILVTQLKPGAPAAVWSNMPEAKNLWKYMGSTSEFAMRPFEVKLLPDLKMESVTPKTSEACNDLDELGGVMGYRADAVVSNIGDSDTPDKLIVGLRWKGESDYFYKREVVGSLGVNETRTITDLPVPSSCDAGDAAFEVRIFVPNVTTDFEINLNNNALEAKVPSCSIEFNPVFPADISICQGEKAIVSIPKAQPGVQYTLRVGDTHVHSVTSAGGDLVFEIPANYVEASGTHIFTVTAKSVYTNCAEKSKSLKVNVKEIPKAIQLTKPAFLKELVNGSDIDFAYVCGGSNFSLSLNTEQGTKYRLYQILKDGSETSLNNAFDFNGTGSEKEIALLPDPYLSEENRQVRDGQDYKAYRFRMTAEKGAGCVEEKVFEVRVLRFDNAYTVKGLPNRICEGESMEVRILDSKKGMQYAAVTEGDPVVNLSDGLVDGNGGELVLSLQTGKLQVEKGLSEKAFNIKIQTKYKPEALGMDPGESCLSTIAVGKLTVLNQPETVQLKSEPVCFGNLAKVNITGGYDKEVSYKLYTKNKQEKVAVFRRWSNRVLAKVKPRFLSVGTNSFEVWGVRENCEYLVGEAEAYVVQGANQYVEVVSDTICKGGTAEYVIRNAEPHLKYWIEKGNTVVAGPLQLPKGETNLKLYFKGPETIGLNYGYSVYAGTKNCEYRINNVPPLMVVDPPYANKVHIQSIPVEVCSNESFQVSLTHEQQVDNFEYLLYDEWGTLVADNPIKLNHHDVTFQEVKVINGGANPKTVQYVVKVKRKEVGESCAVEIPTGKFLISPSPKFPNGIWGGATTCRGQDAVVHLKGLRETMEYTLTDKDGNVLDYVHSVEGDYDATIKWADVAKDANNFRLETRKYCAKSKNLVKNGDFERGTLGITSKYRYRVNIPYRRDELWREGKYSIVDDPNKVHKNFKHCSSYRPESPNMMVVNGSPVDEQTVWSQVVKVEAGQYYVFKAYFASVEVANPAKLKFSIKGHVLDKPINLTKETCRWDYEYVVWRAEKSEYVEIEIVNKNLEGNGNDFAIDDIFFGRHCGNTCVEVMDNLSVGIIDVPNTGIPVAGGAACQGNGIASVKLDLSGLSIAEQEKFKPFEYIVYPEGGSPEDDGITAASVWSGNEVELSVPVGSLPQGKHRFKIKTAYEKCDFVFDNAAVIEVLKPIDLQPVYTAEVCADRPATVKVQRKNRVAYKLVSRQNGKEIVAAESGGKLVYTISQEYLQASSAPAFDLIADYPEAKDGCKVTKEIIFRPVKVPAVGAAVQPGKACWGQPTSVRVENGHPGVEYYLTNAKGKVVSDTVAAAVNGDPVTLTVSGDAMKFGAGETQGNFELHARSASIHSCGESVKPFVLGIIKKPNTSLSVGDIYACMGGEAAATVNNPEEGQWYVLKDHEGNELAKKRADNTSPLELSFMVEASPKQPNRPFASGGDYELRLEAGAKDELACRFPADKQPVLHISVDTIVPDEVVVTNELCKNGPNPYNEPFKVTYKGLPKGFSYALTSSKFENIDAAEYGWIVDTLTVKIPIEKFEEGSEHNFILKATPDNTTGCEIQLAPVNFIVLPTPEIPEVIAPKVCRDETGRLIIKASNPEYRYSFIRDSAAGSPWSKDGNGGDLTVEVDKVTFPAQKYRLEVENIQTYCKARTEYRYVIQSFENPMLGQPAFALNPVKVCEGADASVVLWNVEKGFEYRLKTDAGEILTGPLSGAAGAELTFTVSADLIAKYMGTGTYRLLAEVGASGSKDCWKTISSETKLEVVAKPDASVVFRPAQTCLGSGAVIEIDKLQRGVEYTLLHGSEQLVYAGGFSVPDNWLPEAGKAYEFEVKARFTDPKIQGACETKLTSKAAVTVNPLPDDIEFKDLTACANQEKTLELSVYQDKADYYLLVGSANLKKIENRKITLSAAQVNSGAFKVKAVTASDCEKTFEFKLAVTPVPQLDLLIGAPEAVCEGEDLAITVKKSQPGMAYKVVEGNNEHADGLHDRGFRFLHRRGHPGWAAPRGGRLPGG
ncbi:MAG: hypothetical protein MI784_14655 [Cytophagales bacterium]|nr:hypothetical protein [Cytophagales bacterium]